MALPCTRLIISLMTLEAGPTIGTSARTVLETELGSIRHIIGERDTQIEKLQKDLHDANETNHR